MVGPTTEPSIAMLVLVLLLPYFERNACNKMSQKFIECWLLYIRICIGLHMWIRCKNLLHMLFIVNLLGSFPIFIMKITRWNDFSNTIGSEVSREIILSCRCANLTAGLCFRWNWIYLNTNCSFICTDMHARLFRRTKTPPKLRHYIRRLHQILIKP